MRFVTFRRLGDDQPRLGVDNDDLSTYTDLTARYPDELACTSLLALIDAGDRGLELARSAYLDLHAPSIVGKHDVMLLPPLIPRRRRDTAMMRTHLRPASAASARWAKATTDTPRSFEELLVEYCGLIPFTNRVGSVDRDPSMLSAPDAVVTWPTNSQMLDYELEFAVVIGRDGRDVSPDDARDHIFGYTIYNDWSLRDVQGENVRQKRGVHGTAKDFPGGNVIGPCVVTADEIANPYDLSMTVRVNGEIWGEGSTNQMSKTFEDAVVDLSRGADILAGEVWGTGTTRNGSSFELARRLPRAAYVQLEVEHVGILANYVLPAN